MVLFFFISSFLFFRFFFETGVFGPGGGFDPGSGTHVGNSSECEMFEFFEQVLFLVRWSTYDLLQAKLDLKQEVNMVNGPAAMIQ